MTTKALVVLSPNVIVHAEPSTAWQRQATLAWILAAANVALVFGALGLGAGDRIFAGSMASYGIVGAVIVSRRANRVGWLMVGLGSLASLHASLISYVVLAQQRDGSLPGAGVGAALTGMTWAPVLALVGITLLHRFPTGDLVSPRFRWSSRAAPAFVLFAAAGNMFRPGPLKLTDQLSLENPLGVEGWTSGSDVASGIAGVLLLTGIAFGVASVALRYRRGTPVIRQQLKWFGVGAATLPVAVVLGEQWDQRFQDVLVPISLALIAAAIAIAILRYRLYDLDRLISRTLSWAIVTLILVGIYASLSVLPYFLIIGRSGGEVPDLWVAAATLASATAFRPVRSRVQRAVDRRFNRSRYDAQVTAESFGARLRDEVSLDALTTDLREVVGQALQPATIHLWLRPRDGQA